MDNDPNNNQDNQQQDLQNDIMKDDLKEGLNRAKQKKAEKENSIAHQGAEQAKKQVKTVVKNQINKKFGSTLIKIKAKLAKIVLPAIVVIVIIVVAIGLISFFLNMPGLMIGKVSELRAAIHENASLYLWGENHQLNPDKLNYEKRLELINYISSDLGFDVIGLGFVPVATYDTGTDPETGESNVGKQIIIDYDTELGWKATDSSHEKKLVSDNDLIYYYLMANERAYVINTNGKIGWFVGNDWSGMIDIDDVDAAYQDITIHRDTKMLEIRNSNPHWSELLNKDVFTFSLDGWTGRYGTPIEFSLALHLSTMSSGMVKELITNEDLQTEVHIELQKADCDINFKFYTDSGRVINIPFNPKGNVEDLANKIKQGGSSASINDEDLSIRGIVYASKQVWGKYELDEDSLDIDGYLKGISRHIDTISAVLGNEDMAVINENNSNNYNEFSFSDLSYTNIFGLRSFNGTYDIPGEINFLTTEYNPACGAFVCSYNGSEPDITTGMLGTIYSADFEGINSKPVYYDIYFRPTEDDDHIYDLIYRGRDNENNIVEINLGVQVIVPRANTNACSNGIITVEKIKGLNGIYNQALNPESTLEMFDNLLKTQSFREVFKEIDWFMGTLSINGNIDFANYDSEKVRNYHSSIDDYSYYQDLYNTVVKDLEAGNEEAAKADIIMLYENLNKDYEIILANATKTIDGKESINKILAEKAPGLSVDVLRKLVEQFGGNPDAESENPVEYTQPRITKVIKHWYKDIDYGSDDNIAYEKSTDTISLKYTGDDIDGFSIVAELTPKSGEHLYNQNGQPRVVKGETVYLEGEIIGQTEDIYGNKEPVYNYHWGDGYRATKKIFTQGFYYTFDGSVETSRSIYWQQQLENSVGTYTVAVSNGRIWYASPDLTPGGEKVQEHIINSADYNWPNGVNVEYISENSGLTVGYFTGLNEKDIVRFYRLTINNTAGMRYLSPTKYEYGKVQERTNQINNIWKAMGVASLRKQLSFDNVSANGEVMANTGLSILKNCDTQDADYIYRDLKEMLLDLGYYTQAEFDQLDTAVLRWFIPEYMPKVWPQNTVTNFTVPAQIYPYNDEIANNEDNTESDEESIDLSKQLDEGFKEDLEVIAPGDCRIIRYNLSSNTIEIKFDGISEPKISALDGYTMVISGIKVNDVIETSDDAGNTQTHDISYYLANKNVIKEGSVIGKTGTEVISVTLMNNAGRYISNVEDYMKLPTLGNAIMLDMETEEMVAMIWEFEGVSDADGNPNDEYYQVDHPSGDVATVGHGVTASTVAIWNELGYGGYIVNGHFAVDRIPKEIVDNVSKYKIQKDIDMLDGLLQQAGVEWGGNQKAAWISLYYNGWHSTVMSLIQDYADQNYASLRQKWLYKCVNTGTRFEKGHKNRRAQEWILFWTGESLGKTEAYNKCYVTGEY